MRAASRHQDQRSAIDNRPRTHVYIHGGNKFPTSGTGILIHNSTNVDITGVQILPGVGIINILLDTVDNLQVTSNTIDGLDFGAGVAISCLNSTKGTISNNQTKLYTSTGTGIKNVGCSNVSEQGNTIAGNGGVALVNGITFDAASSNNGPWSLNNIDSATVTTPVSDAGNEQ